MCSRVLRGKLPFTRPYDQVFVAGEAAERRHMSDAAAVTHIHHFDIDAAIANSILQSPPADPYMVFIDDFLPFHPDFEAFGSRTIDPQSYYGALNEFFSAAERVYQATVVIAAHPKAQYAVNPFAGRRIVVGATNALVKHASLVFAHASTAISLAVIHRKPLCLIYTPEIVRVHPFLYRTMALTAEMLGCPILDLEKSVDLPSCLPEVHVKNYAAYYREYLSIADPTTPSAVIVVREFRRLLGLDTALPMTDAGVRQ